MPHPSNSEQLIRTGWTGDDTGTLSVSCLLSAVVWQFPFLGRRHVNLNITNDKSTNGWRWRRTSNQLHRGVTAIWQLIYSKMTQWQHANLFKFALKVQDADYRMIDAALKLAFIRCDIGLIRGLLRPSSATETSWKLLEVPWQPTSLKIMNTPTS